MILEHNRTAWDRQVEVGNKWTVPVDEQQVMEARKGKFSIYLTPCRPVPQSWFPVLKNSRVLCLASGGGQQGPLLAAAGAAVTVYDNSPNQLQQDQRVAERENLDIDIVQGDMRDLSVFGSESFDLIVHPVSNAFVPEVRKVWTEAYRVLREEGILLAGFTNPVAYIFDENEYDKGLLVVKNKIPHSDCESLSEEAISLRLDNGIPLEFGHTLEDQIGGQIDAGFAIKGFYEDTYGEQDLLSEYIACFIATRAIKRA